MTHTSRARQQAGRPGATRAACWLLLAALLLLVRCSGAAPSSLTSPAPGPAATATARPDGLTAEQAATLASLQKVDDYPLYIMRYYGAPAAPAPDARPAAAQPAWGCSLFAALGDAENRLYGRNFDWRFSPALLLFTEPPDGYASVSMVDLAYFGFGGPEDGRAVDPLQLALAGRQSLLDTPSMPFDGMNAAGVAVGMAAVPQADRRHDPGKPTIGELAVMREVLDHAGTVEEAVAILKGYNIDWEGGPPLHYLVADRAGRAALVEFYGGKIAVTPEASPWHAATNFTRSAAAGGAAGQCPRYDTLVARLAAAGGRLAREDAMALLAAVAQPGGVTQWSVIYNMSRGQVDVAMGRDYARVHTYQLGAAGP